MKILICGKGGSGKSTVAALLAKNLLSEGYRVLVVDSDESNYGLSALLGLTEPKELMDQIGGKKALKGKMGKVGSDGEKAPVFSEEWSIDDIPDGYVSRLGNLYLLQIGKVKHYGEGCACPMGVLSRDFLTHLKLGSNDVAIVDTEAGVEHLGRGLVSGVDVVFAVIDPSYESIMLAKRISSMVNESGKPIHFILNKISGALANTIASKIGKEQIIGIIPNDELVAEKGLTGEALDANTADISSITHFVLDLLKGKQA